MFGENGILRFTRDLLIMGVPFMVGALAAVAMGAPGTHMDRRPIGTELYLDGQLLTLRQFVCYLLGYLSFLGLATLILVIGATVFQHAFDTWVQGEELIRKCVEIVGAGVFFIMVSSLTVTVLWSLYFLTEVVNQKPN